MMYSAGSGFGAFFGLAGAAATGSTLRVAL
jgi:hypothetical protein